MRILQPLYLVLLSLILACGSSSAFASAADPPPNFVLILCDNLGYGDVGCYGSTLHRTPHIDRLAKEGLRFASAYAASGVCTPSRASLMTGCYPRRVNMHISDKGRSVLQPVSSKGLDPEEITIAELLKTRGYATTIIGKWHLGDQPAFLPTRQGFDSYLGIPYSDDMTARPNQPWPALPLMKDEKVIEAPVDRNFLTKRYTEAAIEFLEANRDRPFFLYLPHAMPGSTSAPFASPAFQGQSKNGPWGDSVEELDWSTGEILKALKRLDLEKNTLVVWTNDNGAPRRNPPQGSNRPLKGWGYDTSEGGMRVPLIARWPGRIPAGEVSDELVTLMDLYPTLAKLAGAKLPEDRIIDGKDIWPLFSGKPNASSPHEAFYYYMMDQLQAARSDRWKLYLPLEKPRGRATPEEFRLARLYDLKADAKETKNLAEMHPDVVSRLTKFAEAARKDLGDGDEPGQNQRPAGEVPNPTPRVKSH